MALVLRRAEGAPPLVVGHRGAAALAPENSLAAIEAALQLGVDLVELDVVATADGRLVVAHDAPPADAPALDEALALVAASPAGLLLDLKEQGIEADAAAALRRHELVGRTVACSLHTAALTRLRAADQEVAIGFSYPDDRFGVARRPYLAPAVRGALAAIRLALPARAARWVRVSGLDALSLHWTLVSPALVAQCHAADAAVLAWTIPDAATARRVAATGVDAMIADDPRSLMERPTP